MFHELITFKVSLWKINFSFILRRKQNICDRTIIRFHNYRKEEKIKMENIQLMIPDAFPNKKFLPILRIK